MMANILRSEWIKSRRSFAKKLAMAAPFFFVLFAAVMRIFLPEQGRLPWELLLSMIFNWWPVLFVPMGIALLCSLTEVRERKAGSYRAVMSNDISAAKLWFGKIAMLGWLLLLSSAMLIVAAWAAGLLAAGGEVPLARIGAASFLIWLTALGLIPIHLFAAVRFGAFANLALGIAGMAAGVLGADDAYWMFIPWSLPTRLMSPVIGVHPNGVPLEAGDVLLDPSAIPIGIASSLIFLVLFSAATAWWFSQREVR